MKRSENRRSSSKGQDSVGLKEKSWINQMGNWGPFRSKILHGHDCPDRLRMEWVVGEGSHGEN